MSPFATSAGGLLSLLEESENGLRAFALEQLNGVVDQFWPEIADKLEAIETFYEDDHFPHRDLAALVASKVYYHLEEYDEALKLALGAGKLFNLSERSEYVETIIAKAIDEYIKQKTENFDLEIAGRELNPIRKEHEDVVNRMFQRCLDDKQFQQGVGMALECRRLDIVREFILKSGDVPLLLEYCQKTALTTITSKAFRTKVLQLLIEIYNSSAERNYNALCLCHFILESSAHVAEILKTLLDSNKKDDFLVACQIAFDLVNNDHPGFCDQLLRSEGLCLPEPKPVEATAPTEPAGADASAAAGNEATAPAAEEATPAPAPVPAEEPEAEVVKTEEELEKEKNLERLRLILSGKTSTDLHLQFLYRNNRTDLLLLTNLKVSVDSRNSITHNGLVVAHSLMQCGTTSDVFLRNNLEWLAKASNWAKFSATASLGVVHKGHVKESRSILSTYLPQAGHTGSAYSEGGALYAMGLIHAHHRDDATKAYLLQQLEGAATSEVMQHGACLGIGLVCMGTQDETIYDTLKTTLFTDSAVAGEAAAYAIGLVMVGSAHARAIQELVAYAHDTQHEKIIRAAAVALAMMMFRKEEEADPLIDQLLADKDPILRYGGCFAIGLAHVGTSNNTGIRKLLHVSVSDVSDDVRRAAVIALGFVMCDRPEQLPSIVKLLTESYNPHVRYAAAMALGIACAGTAMKEAQALLEPLLTDITDFVRQGALLALGLLFMQASSSAAAEAKKFRAKVSKVVADKHEDVITRFGALIAAGMLDAGGRNCCASFFSESGMLRRSAAIGFVLFTQMWYWFPLIHMFSLTLSPTALICVNERLQMPKMKFRCKAKPSVFAYPEPVQPPQKDALQKTATAVLSTHAKAKAQKQLMEKRKATADTSAPAASSAMDVDEGGHDSVSVAATQGTTDAISVAATQGTTIVGSSADSAAPSDLDGDMMDVEEPKDEKMDERPGEVAADGEKKEAKKDEKKEEKEEKDDRGEEQEKKEEKEEPEPLFDVLENPCRVVRAQVQCISSVPESADDRGPRYELVLKNRASGFMVVKDLRPDEAEEVLDEETKPAADADEEPEPPQPFAWTDED